MSFGNILKIFWKISITLLIEVVPLFGKTNVGISSFSSRYPNFENTSKKDVTPAWGDGFYGGHTTEDDLKNTRQNDNAYAPDRDT